MKGNKITEWSYDLPTEPGLYLHCLGDVEVAQNISYISFRNYDCAYGCCEDSDGKILMTISGNLPEDYGNRGKWARLLIGSDAK